MSRYFIRWPFAYDGYFMAFSMQMSQQMLAHTRLLEAAEVASLALIASPKEDEEKNVKYARYLITIDTLLIIRMKALMSRCLQAVVSTKMAVFKLVVNLLRLVTL